MTTTATDRVTDRIGREIKPGCSVLYPVRRKADMWLSELKVQQIVPANAQKGPSLCGFSPIGRRVNVYNLENVVVLVPLGVCYEEV